MKRLCIVTPAARKYSETFIQNHIKFLPFEIQVITRESGEFELGKDKPIASPGATSRALRFLERKLKNSSFDKQQIATLSSLLKKYSIEHVLFEYGTMARYGYEACLQASIPFTVHFHGYDAYKYAYDQKFYGPVFKNAKHVVVVSDHMKKQLLSLGCPESKISIIPYGTDFKVENTTGQSSDLKKRFLFVGRFVEKKAPYNTILAFEKALRENPGLKLDLVGGGELLPVCKDIVAGLGLEDQITFHGICSHEEVKEMMRKADFYIQHSKVDSEGDSEGLPNSIIEAVILQKPVISTFHSGIPEIVIHEQNGLLSDEGDINAMSANIIKAINFEFSFKDFDHLDLQSSIKKLGDLLNKV